ncbi:Sodium/calcium exchanger membrane region [Penicillium cf. griseofulvum]|uniref:Sodium/calcium exchanger membrane region n=1 Tax=Penicillium cf. griseofulvum TaxID=2972120 RepID=A0A9W9JQU0_9EURO|nr:Sodium/calcium exchanger membrane region [Penicillium cf. griseofulvum]KAJ5423773.1 Sodium/calcium exchanger membrane region [Penicillium cf. griseofulvum]KAJ5430974.1 Sodium/calcium exchanger membrane region [Penicillium cf. griseofulvum]
MNQLPSFLQPTVRKPRYSIRPFYTTLLVFALIATAKFLFTGTTNEHAQVTQPGTGPHEHLFKREGELECRLVRNVKNQCAYVRANCPDHEDGLISYLQFYYCGLAGAKPVAFIILILWLSLLFSTIGIAASDFLCIDLSTLASILGLSESLTGVTFLAFGNGSPDVFSTFAAMRSNSGSLAIGELIGAATFITSVVAGSMALVRPFKVARRSFVRDVGYFVVAVVFSMFMLADGKLHVWESAAMVGLYAFYVVMVVTWHWYLVRQRRKNERDLAARAHFHIPENQELEIEEAAEDDDPGVASESRSLLRGASTEDFDLLERAEVVPLWKKEDEEDDETRNRYLAEIRDNMHVYRPVKSRRNTMNPIRPSLVGALEFQSVLHSLQKSRSTRRNPAISLNNYSDDGDSDFDTRSVASHPRVSRPSATNDRLSPSSAAGSSRVRAVSANDAVGLKFDSSVLEPSPTQGPLLTVSRPSFEDTSGQESLESRQLPRIDTGMVLDMSSANPSPSLSPGTTRPQTPDRLAPSDAFNSPNYHNQGTNERPSMSVSPKGTATRAYSGFGLESPSVPFPSYTDLPSMPFSRPPSIRLPNSVSQLERLQIYDGYDDFAHVGLPFYKYLRNWWPDSIPPPQQIGCTLFPTLAGWKSKNVWERLLGIIAAPSVLLLTITVPVVEPEAVGSVEPDPIPSVIIQDVNDEGNPSPRVRLPADSPVVAAQTHEFAGSVSNLPPTHPHRKSSYEETGRPRWDSELPAAPAPGSPSVQPGPTKDWNRWLVSIQLFTGPFFAVLIAWTTMDEDRQLSNLVLPSLVSLLFSSVCLTVLIISTRRQRNHRRPSADNSIPLLPNKPQPHTDTLLPPWRPFLSLLGFFVAIAWIATIATEVVSLLKTMGVILNISDSLLGLTIFAVGNSLGDLVADITVARLGYPVMALSACFGGPMLNILLGIGLGGLYMTVNGGNQRNNKAIRDVTPVQVPYEIVISKVLVISGATLLVILAGLLIVVPLNNWRMDRRIGWGLIAVWCISTLGNVIAEVVL